MLKQLTALLTATWLILLAPLILAQETFNGEPVQTIEWEALMPEDFSLDDIYGDTTQLAEIDDFSENAQVILDEMMQKMQSTPVVPEMNDKMVKIPGFVVPIEMQGDIVTEFFLVPYFGACIHVPPPPSNQIVYVRFEPGTHINNLYKKLNASSRDEIKQLFDR